LGEEKGVGIGAIYSIATIQKEPEINHKIHKIKKNGGIEVF
jgi:hypothetical protein